MCENKYETGGPYLRLIDSRITNKCTLPVFVVFKEIKTSSKDRVWWHMPLIIRAWNAEVADLSL